MPEYPTRGETIAILGGTVVDATGERRADVLVVDGRIAAVAVGIEVPAGATVLDAGGCLVAPGLVDLHTHLREPGGERAETVETGARAAARGGFTAVVAMPNTVPAVDCAAVVLEVAELGRRSCVEVAVAGAITVGRAGERLAPMAEMAALGVRLFTDDGRGVQDAGLMRRALEYARPLGIVLAQHCEDEQLAAGGSMHEGAWSSRLGIPGQPGLAEEAMLARDLALVGLTGAPMHFLHLSTARSVALLAAARADGLPVTAEVTPHHLALTDACVAGFDPVFKVNPPLRTDDDVAALRRALACGVIDAVATDHAPHAREHKDEPFELAPPGMLGLETAFAVAFGALCGTGSRAAGGTGSRAAGGTGSRAADGTGSSAADGTDDATAMGIGALIGALSTRPARIAGLADQGGPVAPGRPANLCVLDLGATWTVVPDSLASLSANTPYAGMTLTGVVRHTVARGRAVVIDGEAQC